MAAFAISEPGMFFDVPCDDYFADPCPEPSVNNSLIDLLLNKSPAHVAAKHPKLRGGIEAARKETQEMCLGSVVHRLALGQGKSYEVIDAPDFKKKAARELRDAASAAGKVPILLKSYESAEAMAPRVRGHLEEIFNGEPFVSEAVIAWKIATKHGEIWARAMIDAWCPSLMMAVDLKTSTDASASAVEKKMAREMNDTQAAWYMAGLSHLIGKPGQVRFVYLYIEKDEPYASQPFELDEAWRSSAWDLCEEAATIFARCLKLGQWPGYSRNPVLLTPPDWLIRERMFRGFAAGHEHAEARAA